MKNQLKLYPVWSNFIYFIAALYAFFIGMNTKIRLKCFSFLIYAIIILLTGIFSIVYHLNTPSWTNNQYVNNSRKFKKWLMMDQIFAIILLLYSFFFLVFRIGQLYYHQKVSNSFLQWFKKLPLWRDGNFYLSILFIVLSLVFYLIASNHNHDASECQHMNCFHNNLDAYDIFHSNWHIFTSIALLFWITLIHHSYGWRRPLRE